ncbi:MAG: hypothetical protein JWN04_3380 [Myxococcaceae bacterium]|nr:hypothetical protein [Myxococcaceae bacterium]
MTRTQPGGSSLRAGLALCVMSVLGPLLSAACHRHTGTVSSPTGSFGPMRRSRPPPLPTAIEVLAHPPVAVDGLLVDLESRETPTFARWRFELPCGAHRFELRAGGATTTALVDVRASEPVALVLSTVPGTVETVTVRKRKYGDGLTPQQLSDTVREHQGELDRCSGDDRMDERADPRRAVTATVVVRPDGSAESVATRGAPWGEVSDCVGLTILKWRFPEAVGESEFAFPVLR